VPIRSDLTGLLNDAVPGSLSQPGGMPKKEHKPAALREVDHHIHDWLHTDRRKSEHTRQSYRRDVNEFLAATGKDYKSITPGDLNRYKATLQRYAEATQQRKVVALRSFFDYLNSIEETDINLSLFKPPRLRREIDVDKLLTPAEVKAMVEAAEPDAEGYLFVRFIYLTGARVSEAVSLKWRSLTPIKNRGEAALKGKGRKTRRVPIPAELWKDIQKARGAAADSDSVFPTLRDRHCAARLITKLAKAAKIDKPVSPHSFRHACASHLLEKGANVAGVRDLLGHSNISTTNLYAHTTNTAELAEKLDIK
jgi:integrase/recombinase XerD